MDSTPVPAVRHANRRIVEPDPLSWLQPVPEERRQVHPRLTYNWPAILLIIGGTMVGFVIGCAITFGIMAPALTVPGLPPCVTEDSTGCYWDAETQGNGTGHDVVTP
jgi:hypothetical protein